VSETSVAAVVVDLPTPQNGFLYADGVTSKKILDLVLPRSGAGRVSIDIEKLSADAAKIRQVLDEACANNCNQAKFEKARAEIAKIIERTVASSHVDRVKLQAAIEHTRCLGERYLTFLAEDFETLEGRSSEIGTYEVVSLLELDTPVIRPTPDAGHQPTTNIGRASERR
jgi:hypothetical protein